ncbi:MAG: envelope stress response membrane protein PspC [Desulfobulbaceae bacterium]|nr:MAG: envelope stress response membrane protein PspC [Desulfobulbaceae bacterium]
MSRFTCRKGGIYRSKEGVLLGVCKGFANYFDFSVFWVRAGMIVIFLLSGFWPVIGIYLVAALLMKTEPINQVHNEVEQEFYESYTNSPRNAAERLKRKFQDLDRRIRRMEDTVTGKEYEWDRRFRSGA